MNHCIAKNLAPNIVESFKSNKNKLKLETKVYEINLFLLFLLLILKKKFFIFYPSNLTINTK